MDYHVDYMTKLNPHTLPWRPEGSEPATRFGEASFNLASQTLTTAKPSGLGHGPFKVTNGPTPGQDVGGTSIKVNGYGLCLGCKGD